MVAVSKTFGVEHVRAAAAAGQRDFGENRVQEAVDKMAALADLPLNWHFIGHLQSNKARKAGASFAVIHSIDSVDLLQRVDRAALEAGVSPEGLVQVDLAGEATKFGAELPHLRDIFTASSTCRALRIVGLMLLPPFSEDPEATRPYFVRLRNLQQDLLTDGVDPASVCQLSMGMSHDYEVAVQEGATIVRVGTAIFGRRSKQ